MIHRPAGSVVFLATCLYAIPVWSAGESAEAWLKRINHAARDLNYEGTFVYQHGQQLDAMRIIHRVKNGSSQERLISLNGSAREIIRNDFVVWCYLPDEKRVVVEHRRPEARRFPTLLPDSIGALSENYTLQLGSTDRVAGRSVQLVMVKPRDGFRYGYQLWADQETGLLLKADLVDRDSNLLEQFLFAQIEIGRNIGDQALRPSHNDDNLDWVAPPTAPSRREPAAAPQWEATELPKGFRLASHRTRDDSARRNLTAHLVYSDGLAAVSVFVERLNSEKPILMEGASRMGAVHAFGRRVDDHHVTVVGEVPAATVGLIAGSISRRR
jgi:sigma-E factor negative regulatory protein RseB